MRAVIAMAALIGCSSAVQAQHHEPVADVVNLQAEASREVENDQLVAVLAAEAQGANPAELTEMVNRKMADALKTAKEVPSVKLRSGNYQTFPQRGKEGRIESWQVSQELRLEAGDVAAAAKLIGRLQQSLNTAGGGPRPMQYEFAAAARAAPVAIEAGLSQVTVTVSGSIQLQR